MNKFFSNKFQEVFSKSTGVKSPGLIVYQCFLPMDFYLSMVSTKVLHKFMLAVPQARGGAGELNDRALHCTISFLDVFLSYDYIFVLSSSKACKYVKTHSISISNQETEDTVVIDFSSCNYQHITAEMIDNSVV